MTRLVAAVVGQGALTFDLAVPGEVFGLDRSDMAVIVPVAGSTRCSFESAGPPP
jgi:hypothetical protein